MAIFFGKSSCSIESLLLLPFSRKDGGSSGESDKSPGGAFRTGIGGKLFSLRLGDTPFLSISTLALALGVAVPDRGESASSGSTELSIVMVDHSFSFAGSGDIEGDGVGTLGSATDLRAFLDIGLGVAEGLGGRGMVRIAFRFIGLAIGGCEFDAVGVG